MKHKIMISEISSKKSPLDIQVEPVNPNQQALAKHDRPETLIKPTLKRYIVLFLYCINAGLKSFQWIQLSASTKKLTYYYNVDNFVINASSVLFMIMFVVLSYPSCYLIKRIGLRNAILVGSFGAGLGSVLKCFSAGEEGIYVLFVGLTFVSLSEQFIFSVPSRLASVWFPDYQVSRALAMTVLGTHLGCALGFIVPQMVLNGAETKAEIGRALFWLNLGVAIFALTAFVLDWILFDEAPKFAPGAARLEQINGERSNCAAQSTFSGEMTALFNQTKRLLNNKDFTILTQSYGINVAVFYSISTVLNQTLDPLYPGDDILIGNAGFLLVVCGAISSTLWGQVLDKLHRYMLVNIFLIFCNVFSMVVFAYVLTMINSHLAIYLSVALLGFFQSGFTVAGLELAVELTYPAPELVTSSLMNLMPQIYGCFITFIASTVVDQYGPVALNGFFIACMAVSLTLLLNIKEVLKRQSAVIEKTLMDQQQSIEKQEVC